MNSSDTTSTDQLKHVNLIAKLVSALLILLAAYLAFHNLITTFILVIIIALQLACVWIYHKTRQSPP